MGSDSSKVEFSSHLKTFQTQRLAPDDHAYWHSLFTTHLPESDLQILLSPELLRSVRRSYPSNLGLFFIKSLEQLYLYSRESDLSHQYVSAKNSLFFLCRQFPFLLEHDQDQFLSILFQQNAIPGSADIIGIGSGRVGGGAEAEAGAEEIEGEMDLGERQEFVTSSLLSSQQRRSLLHIDRLGKDLLLVPLQREVVVVFLEALLTPQMCIPLKQVTQRFIFLPEERLQWKYPRDLDPNLLWYGGLVVPKKSFGSGSPGSQIVSNRIGLVKALLFSMSGSLYLSPAELFQRSDPFLEVIVSPALKVQTRSCLFYSFLNVLAEYNPLGRLPYSSVLLHDDMEEIALYVSQLLGILLCHPLSKRTSENVWVSFVKDMARGDDFQALGEMFAHLFHTMVEAKGAYLPNSQKRILMKEELAVLLLKFLQHNLQFRSHLCRDRPTLIKLFTAILFAFNEENVLQEQFYREYLQILAFLLVSFSEERSFAVALSATPASASQPVPGIRLPLFSGSFSDVLILFIHKMIVGDDKKLLVPLWNCLITVISNVSPFTKSMSVPAASRLVDLIRFFSLTSVLFGGQSHPELLVLLLTSVNHLMQYQYEGNVNLAYCLLRSRNIFDRIVHFPDILKIRSELQRREITFEPTRDWIDSWKETLEGHLEPWRCIFKSLLPEVERLCEKDTTTEDDVLSYLRETTLVGVLPQPPPIVLRSFVSTPRIDLFLQVFLWGLVYMKTLDFLPPDAVQFDRRKIKLFSVRVVDEEERD